MCGAVWLIGSAAGRLCSSLSQSTASLLSSPLSSKDTAPSCSAACSPVLGKYTATEISFLIFYFRIYVSIPSLKLFLYSIFSPSDYRIGGSIPIVFSYYSEFLAQEKRGEHLSWLCMFWMIGGIYASAMAWAIIPHYGNYQNHYNSHQLLYGKCINP